MGFTALFLLLLVTAGWWLHSRWSALRAAQDARREAELMMVFEARSRMGDKAAAATAAASDFYPTLPDAQQQAGIAKRNAASQARRPRATE